MRLLIPGQDINTVSVKNFLRAFLFGAFGQQSPKYETAKYSF